MSLTENSDQVFLPGGATELKVSVLAPTLTKWQSKTMLQTVFYLIFGQNYRF